MHSARFKFERWNGTFCDISEVLGGWNGLTILWSNQILTQCISNFVLLLINENGESLVTPVSQQTISSSNHVSYQIQLEIQNQSKANVIWLHKVIEISHRLIRWIHLDEQISGQTYWTLRNWSEIPIEHIRLRKLNYAWHPTTYLDESFQLLTNKREAIIHS